MQKGYALVVILFVFISTLVLIFKSFLNLNGFAPNFLLIANSVLFVVTFLGFLIQTKGLKSTNVNVFMRSIYFSLLLKMFVVMIAVLIYLFVTRGKINKPSLFTSMGLYFVYTSIEAAQLMKIARRKPNA